VSPAHGKRLSIAETLRMRRQQAHERNLSLASSEGE
jgi:hypothetical protein